MSATGKSNKAVSKNNSTTAAKVPTPSIKPPKPSNKQQKSSKSKEEKEKPAKQKQSQIQKQKTPETPKTKEERQKPASSKVEQSKREPKDERRKVLAVLRRDEDRNRLLRPYPFKAKSLEFRSQFDHLLAKSYVWVPRSPDSFHELLTLMSQAVAYLGFDEAAIASSHSAQYTSIQCLAEPKQDGLDLNNKKLSLLWIRPPEYSWNQLQNYLVYRQVDVRHEGIVNKWLLIANLKESDQRLKYKTRSGARFSSDLFLPETICLDMPFDELLSVLGSSEGTYIIKEVRGTKGRNMNLLRLTGSCNNGQQDLLQMLQKSRLMQHRLSDVVLQKYIEKPLLVDRRKFDFRVYMLMVNASRKEKSEFQKGFFVYCHPGFLRLCIMSYQPESGDLLCHLTNQHVQMNSILYDRYKEVTVWEPDELNRYFNSKGGLPDKDYVRNVIYPKIGAIVGYLGSAFTDILNDGAIQQANTFKVFGVDFLVGSDLSVQLLEVNELPSWKRQTKVLERLKSDLWREAVALSTETVLKFRQRQSLEPLVSQYNFQLVYSSEQPQVLSGLIAKHFS